MRGSNRREGLHPLEYGWLILPLFFAFLAFPLARVALAGICFVWVAALLLQRVRGVSYLRSWLMTGILIMAWLSICTVLTMLAEGLFRRAGEVFSENGYMVTGVLMATFTVYGIAAALAVRLLGIGGWRDTSVLLATFLLFATGAAFSGMSDSPWTFPAGVTASAALLALHLRKNT